MTWDHLIAKVAAIAALAIAESTLVTLAAYYH